MSTHARLFHLPGRATRTEPSTHGSKTRALPGQRPLKFAGCIVLIYGAVLIAGYGMLVQGLLVMAVGLAIRRVDYRRMYHRCVAARVWLALAMPDLSGKHVQSRSTSKPGRARAARRSFAVLFAVLGTWMPLPAAHADVRHAAVHRGTVLTAPVAQASGVRDLTYGGLTSQGEPAYLELAPGGVFVKRAIAGLDFKCSNGDTWGTTDQYRGLRISGRRFAQSFSYPPDKEGDETTSQMGSISGRFDPRMGKVTGTWKGTLRYENAKTGERGDCLASARFTLYR